jgi:hypothetical protein
MNTLVKHILLGTLIAPLVAPGALAQAAMTGEQIKAAVSGKSYDFAGQYNGVMEFGADGSASLTLRIGTKRTGSWQVKGNEFCSTWQGEAEQCATWTSESGGTIKTSKGFTLTPK